MRLALPLALFVMLAGPAAADEPKAGETVTLACRREAAQRYACYLPKAYDPAKAWPILYLFAPDTQGDVLLSMFREACEAHGWVGVGSLVVQAGDRAPNLIALDELWDDTEQRLSLSKTQRYAGGFSAGARISFLLAEKHPKAMAGVIAIGAGMPKDKRLPAKSLSVFLGYGETDFNRAEMETLARGLASAGNRHLEETFPGGHRMPRGDVLARAVAWLDGLSPEKRASKLREGLTDASSLADGGDPVAAFRKLVDLVIGFPDVTAHADAVAALRRRLAKEPAVKDELAAFSRYEKAVAYIEKNLGRLAESRSVRSRAKKKLEGIVKRYPGTRAAELAKARMARLSGN